MHMRGQQPERYRELTVADDRCRPYEYLMLLIHRIFNQATVAAIASSNGSREQPHGHMLVHQWDGRYVLQSTLNIVLNAQHNTRKVSCIELYAQHTM